MSDENVKTPGELGFEGELREAVAAHAASLEGVSALRALVVNSIARTMKTFDAIVEAGASAQTTAEVVARSFRMAAVHHRAIAAAYELAAARIGERGRTSP